MSTNKKRLLIVDDEVGILEIARDLITNSEVITAESFKEALLILEREKIDAVISDLHLGGKSGLDLLQVASSKYGITKIAIFTGDSCKMSVKIFEKPHCTFTEMCEWVNSDSKRVY